VREMLTLVGSNEPHESSLTTPSRRPHSLQPWLHGSLIQTALGRCKDWTRPPFRGQLPKLSNVTAGCWWLAWRARGLLIDYPCGFLRVCRWIDGGTSEKYWTAVAW